MTRRTYQQDEPLQLEPYTARSSPGSRTITLDGKVTVRIFGLAILALVLANTAVHVAVAVTGRDTMLGLVRAFSLDHEMNLATWFSSVMLLFSACLLAVVTFAEWNSKWSLYWLGLGVIFAGLSIDEIAAFHEMIIVPTRTLLGLSGLLLYAWMVPAAVMLVIGAGVYAKWFWHLPPQTRKLAALSAILFVGGALGIESVSSLVTSRGLHGTSLYRAITTVEETFEMCGVLCWIYTLIDYAQAQGHKAVIRFSAAGEQA